MTEPITELDVRYSEPGSAPVSWEWGRQILSDAELYWITTVRPDGRPHVTPLIGVWLDEALHFCTGPGERKALNLRANPAVALTTGTNAYAEGFDVVVEGFAEPDLDVPTLVRLAEAYVAKYGPQWRFEVTADGFHGGGGPALVYRVAPVTAFGFGKGQFSQTRWRFGTRRPGPSAGLLAGE